MTKYPAYGRKTHYDMDKLAVFNTLYLQDICINELVFRNHLVEQNIKKIQNTMQYRTIRFQVYTPHLPEDIGHLLSLLLCPLVSSELSFSNLQSTLVLANLQKLSDSLLIRSKPSNLPDQAPDHGHPLCCFLQIIIWTCVRIKDK